jgi:hypothetical protein
VLRRRPSPALVVAFLALLVAMSGVGYAAIPARDGDVHLCYSKKTGDVVVVDTQSDDFDCEKKWSGFVLDSKPTSMQSPDGRFKMSVTNSGVQLTGPNASVVLGDEAMTVDAGKDLAVNVGGNATLNVVKSLNLETGDAIGVKTRRITALTTLGTTLTTKDLTVSASGKIDMKASGDVTIKGSKVTQNR